MKKLTLLLLLTATPVFAHAKLTSSNPADGAKVKAPSLIKLEFSEALEPAFSGAELAGPDGKTIKVSTSVGATGITLIPGSLKPGAYAVTWHSVGHDTHRVTGQIHFTVTP